MHAPLWILWLLALAVGVQLICFGASIEAASCEGCEAWEALEAVFNSTGNLTDVGYNRTAGGNAGSKGGGMNHTTQYNASIPSPNGTRVPSPGGSQQPSSPAHFVFSAKTVAATLVVVVGCLSV